MATTRTENSAPRILLSRAEGRVRVRSLMLRTLGVLGVLGALSGLASGLSPAAAQGDSGATVDAPLDARAFETEAALQILPLESRDLTRDALADALLEINELDALFDPNGEFGKGLGALNRGAGKGPVELDDRVIEALRRAQLFCIWSENAHGPVGGVLYGAWSLRRPAGGAPTQQFLVQGTQSARCEHLELNFEARTASLAQTSRVDLWGFDRGFAVDRAVLRLQQAGALGGWVQVGGVVRAFSIGSQGDLSAHGWQVALDATGPDDQLIERLVLTNQAMAMVGGPRDRRLEILGQSFPAYLDQRTGAPVTDKTAVFVVTENAFDAHGLAVALFVQNPREGQFRAGLLEPRPAVKWLLGTLDPPIESSSGWAQLDKWTPSRLQLPRD